MAKYEIIGGTPLKGEVVISGAKNAVVAILPATLLVPGKCRIENVPNISDVRILLDIMRSMGATVDWAEPGVVEIDCANVPYCEPNADLVRKMRASYYLLGAQLGRYGRSHVALPGGCAFAARPIDQHIKGFGLLGADVTETEEYVEMVPGEDGLRGQRISLDVVSVGATANIMMAACLIEGQTVIENAAKEPHIVDLANFLTTMGARITNYDDAIRSQTDRRLRHATVKTRPYPGFPTDMQAQICVCMTLATGVSRLIESVYETRFFGYCSELERMGASIQIEGKTATVTGTEKLHGAVVGAKDLRAGAALVIAGLSAEGQTVVENIHYVERGYENIVEKLTALGADIRREDD